MNTNPSISKKSQSKEYFRSFLVGWSLIAFFWAAYAFEVYKNSTLWSQSAEAMLILGANYAPLTWYSQEWRLFTHIFIHNNVAHLLVNSIALWAVWKRSAVVFCAGTQLYIFLVCGVASGWIGATQQFDSVGVGASGAILGLLAAVVGWSTVHHFIWPGITKAIAGFPIVALLLVTTASVVLPGLNAYTTIGGVLAGFIFGVFVSSKSEQEHGATTAIVLVGVTGALFCIAMIVASPNEETLQRVQREQVSRKAIEYIHAADRTVEEAMNTLWAKRVREKNATAELQSEATEKKRVDSNATQTIWRAQWRARVVLPLERNAAMAASLSTKPNDVEFVYLGLLQRYTASRLQEARLLESSNEQAYASDSSGAALRQRIIELSRQMYMLSSQQSGVKSTANASAPK